MQPKMSIVPWLRKPAPNQVPSDFRRPNPPLENWSVIRKNILSLLIVIVTVNSILDKCNIVRKRFGFPKGEFWRETTHFISLHCLGSQKSPLCSALSSRDAPITLSPRMEVFHLLSFLKLLSLFLQMKLQFCGIQYFQKSELYSARRKGRGGDWNLPGAGPAWPMMP